QVEQVEALCDREQAARLRGRVAVVGDVGAVHDTRQQPQGGVIELVLLNQHLEGTQPVAVCVLGVRGVVRVGALAFSYLEYLVGGHVEELRVLVDEVLDQPGTGDPVGLRSCTCHPLHRVLLSYEGSLPVSRARLRYSYKPSKSGPESERRSG